MPATRLLVILGIMTDNTSGKKLMNGWFSETSPIWPGIAVSIEVEATLYSGKSKYQQIDLYQTTNHGKMLVLDNIIQLTDVDEFAYQEMLTHVPLFAHPSPENVLVIGGGDGGVLREIEKHDCVRRIDICEIDEEVIRVSKKFLPNMSCGFNDPRVSIHIADGSEFVCGRKNEYDVIIVDSSDPVGPGEILFEKGFYTGCRQALTAGGIVAVQGESFFLHADKVEKMAGMMKPLFDKVAYSNFIVPSFTGGHIGSCLGSIGPGLTTPSRKVPEKIQDSLKYYNAGVHEASFVLPQFAAKLIKEA